MGHSDRGAENCLFIEKRVEHTARTELLIEPIRDIVDAAFLRDVFPENHRTGITGECFGQPHLINFAKCRGPWSFVSFPWTASICDSAGSGFAAFGNAQAVKLRLTSSGFKYFGRDFEYSPIAASLSSIVL